MRPAFTLGQVWLAERLAWRATPRVPEPAMVMDDAQQVDDYAAAGDDHGAMSPTHLFHSAQAAALIQPGDRVLDLGCGPGTQLIQLASLRHDASFVGVDLSDAMLDQAARRSADAGLTNIDWQPADITRLDAFADASFDMVISSMTLHHLPTAADLHRCFAEVRRVLREAGRVYFGDFARLHTATAMRALAHMRADQQPDYFTRDYYNSLRAAFSPQQWREAADAARLDHHAPLHHHVTRPIGLMQIMHSPPPADIDPALRHAIDTRRDNLGPTARQDLAAIVKLFRSAGLATVVR